MGTEYAETGCLSDVTVERILDFEGTPRQLVDYIGELWSVGPGRLEARPANLSFDAGIDWAPRDYFCWSIATAGESFNEDIIGALENTMFWFMYWESSHRGGGYTFHIAQEQMDIPTFLGDLKHYEARQREAAGSDRVQGS